jgi:putative ATP-binding cassette transporter
MELLKILGKESPKITAYIVILSFISGVAGGVIVPLVLTAAQDVISGKRYLHYIIILPLITTLLILTKRVSQKQTAILTETILKKLLLRVANHIRHAELMEMEQRSRSDIFLTMVNTQEVTNAATKSINVFQISISLCLCWFYILWLSPPAGFTLLLAFALAVTVYEIFHTLTHHAVQEETQKERELFHSFHHVLDGFKELKLNRHKNDDLFDKYLIPLISVNKKIRTRAAFYFSDFHIFTDVCEYLAMGSIVFLLSSLDWHGTVLTIFAVINYQAKLILVLLAQLPDIIKGKVALERLNRLAEEEVSRKKIGEYLYKPSQEIITGFQTITLENIRFEYQTPNGTPGFSVGPINFTIRAGEILFIVGGNGSGKTTLIKILTGLYPPFSGLFKIDGERVSMSAHRYLFSLIFSDFHLFDRIYGVDPIDDQKVNNLLIQMELAYRTQWIEGRFSNLDLSGGQKKRLALVVAMLEDKPVYVFDEWAADQAPYFRRYFYTDLLPSLKAQGKTVIAVSHDEKYFDMADRVMKMDYGKIVERS